jgi:SAM-dependent methyltransferase
MSNSRYSREKWDQRWQEKAQAPESPPDDWLLRVLPYLPERGAALDLACGMGRNALSLAQVGYQVTAVDFSQVAIDVLRVAAARESLPVDAICADIEAPRLLVSTRPLRSGAAVLLSLSAANTPVAECRAPGGVCRYSYLQSSWRGALWSGQQGDFPVAWRAAQALFRLGGVALRRRARAVTKRRIVGRCACAQANLRSDT